MLGRFAGRETRRAVAAEVDRAAIDGQTTNQRAGFMKIFIDTAKVEQIAGLGWPIEEISPTAPRP
jgi:hypothetical protein